MFKLALAQMLVVGGGREANLARAGEMIARAAAGGARAVLLPECVDLGWMHPSAKTMAEPIPDGMTCRFFQDQARRHRVYLCGGLVERDQGAIHNSALLLDPAGEILLHHSKLNEIVPGHSTYAQGDRLAVVRTPLGTLGLMICADGFAEGHVITRTLGYMGADVILSPSAWAVRPEWDNVKTPYREWWRPHYAPVARDFEIWIASASNVGKIHHTDERRDWPCIGSSLVYGPDGEEKLCGSFGAEAVELLFIDIEPRPRPARACGWPVLWKQSVESDARTP
jgi:predicted amidohydrolase